MIGIVSDKLSINLSKQKYIKNQPNLSKYNKCYLCLGKMELATIKQLIIYRKKCMKICYK